MSLLEVKDVHYKKNFKPILTDIHFELEEGQFVGLLGQNGAGKTTLMRLIAGLAHLKEGEIAINGKSDVVSLKAQVSYTGNFSGFDKGMKIDQVVNFYQDVYPNFERERYDQIADFLKIDPKNKLESLSKGMKEQLILALTLSRRVPLYLLDEPFSGIDIIHRQKIMESILKWMDEKATVIISDHYVEAISPILDGVMVIHNHQLTPYLSTEIIREERGLSVEEYFTQVIEGSEPHD